MTGRRITINDLTLDILRAVAQIFVDELVELAFTPYERCEWYGGGEGAVRAVDVSVRLSGVLEVLRSLTQSTRALSVAAMPVLASIVRTGWRPKRMAPALAPSRLSAIRTLFIGDEAGALDDMNPNDAGDMDLVAHYQTWLTFFNAIAEHSNVRTIFTLNNSVGATIPYRTCTALVTLKEPWCMDVEAKLVPHLRVLRSFQDLDIWIGPIDQPFQATLRSVRTLRLPSYDGGRAVAIVRHCCQLQDLELNGQDVLHLVALTASAPKSLRSIWIRGYTGRMSAGAWLGGGPKPDNWDHQGLGYARESALVRMFGRLPRGVLELVIFSPPLDQHRRGDMGVAARLRGALQVAIADPTSLPSLATLRLVDGWPEARLTALRGVCRDAGVCLNVRSRFVRLPDHEAAS